MWIKSASKPGFTPIFGSEHIILYNQLCPTQHDTRTPADHALSKNTRKDPKNLPGILYVLSIVL